MVLIEPADHALRLELEELRIRAQEGPRVDRGGELLKRGVGLERLQVPLLDPSFLRGVRYREFSRFPRMPERGGDAPGRHGGRALNCREIGQVDEVAGCRRRFRFRVVGRESDLGQ
jgi:hypothetical protein